MLVPHIDSSLQCTDYPFNFGVTLQKNEAGGELGNPKNALFYCLANDSCCMKKVNITVPNLRYRAEEATRKLNSPSKVKRIYDSLKPQCLGELDKNTIIEHLKECHWGQLIRSGYIEA